MRLLVCNQTLGLDEAEQIVFAQQLSAGYPSQPPLYTWLQHFIFQLLGTSLFSIALLKYSLIFLAIYFYHLLCRLYCKSSLLAWCATLSWALIPSIGYDLLPHRTHVILALLTACLTWYWFIRPSDLPKALWYAVFGLIIGAGLLSKFNYLIFLAVFLMTTLTVKEYRIRLLQPSLIITLIVALLSSGVYWWWLINNLQVGLYASYKLVLPGKGQWSGIIHLLEAIFSFVIPLIIIKLFFPLSHRKGFADAKHQLLLRYHLLVLPLIVVGMVGGGVHNFKSHWILPLLFLSPLWLFSFANERTFSVQKAKSYASICLIVQAVLICLWVGRSPYLAQFPLQQLITRIKNEQQPVAVIISDSHWLLGSLMLRLSINEGVLMHPAKPAILPAGELLVAWEGEQLPQWVNNTVSAQSLTNTITTANQKAAISYAYRLEKPETTALLH